MKIIKKILLCLISIISIVLLNSCRKTQLDFICGDFIYRVIEVNGEKMAAIRETSDQGTSKKVLIMPEYLDGYRVYGMYDNLPNETVVNSFKGHLHSPNLEKLYLPYKFKINYKIWGNIFFLCDIDENEEIQLGRYANKVFYTSKVNIEGHATSKYISEYIRYTVNADVTYYNNYGDDSIYWIDDYDNEVIKYKPADPVREGYTFDGWYKESECINEWNFETDIVPLKEYIGRTEKNGSFEYSSDYKYLYNETKLYAKWVLNE